MAFWWLKHIKIHDGCQMVLNVADVPKSHFDPCLSPSNDVARTALTQYFLHAGEL